MASTVVSHVALGAEALAAQFGAHEGALVVVDAHVNPEVLLFREGFPAGFIRALVGLSAIV